MDLNQGCEFSRSATPEEEEQDNKSSSLHVYICHKPASKAVMSLERPLPWESYICDDCWEKVEPSGKYRLV